ncbi:hypothetical protein SAMN02983003_0201 [Devosia enhydra]|uniref:Uncharacterized protein n=1 Tax=Devosia enhydra TaxID=665118 RepID=A0A1K2HSX4_9HYPH|nr:hypothetical protein [Devosia enhydra]SFZ80907.1 hypothetical protein SAMN02983003_0201 [Devosia enhydra]
MRLPSKRHLAPVLALLLSASPALAWTQIKTDEFVAATQLDADETYILSYSCDMAFGLYVLAIETGEPWDAEAEYQETVEVVFTVDGTALEPVAIPVTELGGNIGLMLTEIDDGFDIVYDGLLAATARIDASLLDTTLTFDGSETAPAFDDVDLICWDE